MPFLLYLFDLYLLWETPQARRLINVANFVKAIAAWTKIGAMPKVCVLPAQQLPSLVVPHLRDNSKGK